MGRDDFYHPYTPYHIQLQLMKLIYDTIDGDYKIGLFESPTGTGKTLSLICSTMTWLREYKKQQLSKNIIDDQNEPAWVNQQYKDNILSKQKTLLRDYEIYLDSIKFEKPEEVPNLKKRKIKVEIEDDLIPKDYQSDEEDEDRNNALSEEIKQLLFQTEGVSEATTTISNPVKIFYSSRTHSQLSQFSSQLSGLKFPSSFDSIDERIKYLPLGSRKQYCINDKINKKSATQINDECLELQKSTSKSCTFFPTPQTQSLVKLFIDSTFAEIQDIEDLVQTGAQIKICPYYSVRSGIEISEIISLPYQLLLEKTSRDILHLNIDDSIIVIDEAHNLIDTIQLMNSTSVSLSEIKEINSLLLEYFKKFKKRFNSGNRINLMKIIKVLKILQEFLMKKDVINGEEFNVTEIYDNNTSDLTNFYKLEDYLRKSKIAFKLDTFMQRSSSQPLLFKIISFLKSLSNPSNEGKFYFNKDLDGETSMKYLLLNPLDIFTDLIKKSRCIILAGGTMEPMEDYHRYLFPSLSDDQIKTFTCGHVIPKENLKSFIVSEYQNKRFEFTFKHRKDSEMINTLLSLLIKIIANVPHGVVIFFPSFGTMETIVSMWKLSGKYDELNKIKSMYKEDRTSTEDPLMAYTSNVDKGAILLSVMNGKLSEGINFNDKLCRAVIMIGLPYPNEFSSDMILKRKYIYEKCFSQTKDLQLSERSSREMVENVMIRTVNQSCGRCIRHVNDYSVIVMIDFRYHKVVNKLSRWIRDRLSSEDAVTGCESFYLNR